MEAFRRAVSQRVKTEAEAIWALEMAFAVVDSYDVDTIRNRYFLLVDQFIQKFSLRYDLRRPFTLHNVTYHSKRHLYETLWAGATPRQAPSPEWLTTHGAGAAPPATTQTLGTSGSDADRSTGRIPRLARQAANNRRARSRGASGDRPAARLRPRLRGLRLVSAWNSVACDGDRGKA
jgi:hypothetical protein